MRTHLVAPAAVSQTTPQVIALSGCWTARGLGEHAGDRLLQTADSAEVEASGIEALDTAGAWVLHPSRIRWRAVLFNLRIAGLDALPIVGLLSFLLGVVVAYQGADQLRQYGANILWRTWWACRCCASSPH